jgi:hypothetical protein
MDKTNLDVDMEGPFRAEQLADGWYAVGLGILIPCCDRSEAEAVAQEFAKSL